MAISPSPSPSASPVGSTAPVWEDDIFDEDPVMRTRTVALMEGATGTGNGSWMVIEGCRNMTVTFSGWNAPGGATVQVRASSDPTKPADTAHGTLLDSVSTNKVIQIPSHIKWLKCRITQYTGGTLYAYLVGEDG